MNMHWQVIKSGAPMFDWLHASGLGILLSYACEGSILVVDEGCWYQLSSQIPIKKASLTLFDEVFALPHDGEEIRQAAANGLQSAPLPIANLDGLLAALITDSRGVRVCSITSLSPLASNKSDVITQALLKGVIITSSWKNCLSKKSAPLSDWLSPMLFPYELEHLHAPVPTKKTSSNGFTISMTIDPALGYALRQERSDGTSTKENVTIQETPAAPLLVYIGAMRFLRAQIVADKAINYYLPLAQQITLTPTTTLPLMYPARETPPHQALFQHWLAYKLAPPLEEATWQHLAFHMLQTQAAQQPITREQGYLEVTWPTQFQEMSGKHMLACWKHLSDHHSSELLTAYEHLEEAVLWHDGAAWIRHLADITRLAGTIPSKLFNYELSDVKGVLNSMESPHTLPLRSIIDRKAGTLRFGHALRLLRQVQPAAARDIIEELAQVTTRDQLIVALGFLLQQCSAATAKTEFMIIPDDDDFAYVSDDIDAYSAHTVAATLTVLSNLRFPHKEATAHTADTQWRLLSAFLKYLKEIEYHSQNTSPSDTSLLQRKEPWDEHTDIDISLYPSNQPANTDL